MLKQNGLFRIFGGNGSERSTTSYYCCYYCNQHSKKPGATTQQWTKVRIDDGALSITDIEHHPDCTPLTQREIAFQEFDRQCRKLVKENGLDHILAYEKVNL